MQISVKSNVDQVLARLKSFERAVIDRAIVSALNRCAEMARTDASRELRAAGYNIRASTIKASISISHAGPGRLVAKLRVNRKPIPLMLYEARQTTAGVSVKVKGSRSVIKGAFIAKMKSGHLGVFERAPGAKHKRVIVNGKARSSSLPITQLFGPSVGGAYAADTVQAAMARAIANNFNRRFAHEMKRLTSRGSK